MRLGRIDDAIAHFAEAARLNPQMADAQNNWGYALTRKGQLREAEAHYQAAVDIDPNFTQARMNAAHVRQELANAR
jgi:Flp pilus assembly protein TadD